MSRPQKIVTAADMDRMTPQQRADVIDAALERLTTYPNVS